MKTTVSIQDIGDRELIRENLARYCSAMDRMNREAASAIWCRDSVLIYHGMYQGDGAGFVDWVWEQHQGMRATSHQISQTLIEVAGEAAVSEAYVSVFLWPVGEKKSAQTEIQVRGRYLDHWRKERENWRIARREFVVDMQSVTTPQEVEQSASVHSRSLDFMSFCAAYLHEQ